MSFSIGLVGLPNVGKSTLFEAITQKQVPKENYPFCTIDPHVGTVAVPDTRLEKLSTLSQSRKTVNTTIEFTDIAGLVQNAHKGEGLGNQFLSHIREVDAICHVVRIFTDSNITHVHSKIDPHHDIDIINLELIMADIETAIKRKNSLEKKLKGVSSKEDKAIYAVIEKALDHLQKEMLLNTLTVTPDEKKLLVQTNFLTIKPMLYAYNSDERITTPPDTSSLKKPFVLISAPYELALSQMKNDEKEIFLKEASMTAPAIDSLIRAAYDVLSLNTFYTSGVEESRAWTLPNGATAYDAAAEIHTDIADGLVKADIVPFETFISCKGWNGARDAGKISTEGRNYTMKDGDVAYFHSTA